MTSPVPSLGSYLDRLYTRYHSSEYLSSDPLEFVHRYSDPADQEVVAVVAAVLAYGNVKQIRHSVTDVLARFERAGAASPKAAVLAVGSARGLAKLDQALRGFKHRFNVGLDILTLLKLVQHSWCKYGSVGGHFLKNHERNACTIGPALDALIQDWRTVERELEHRSPTFGYLLTAPQDGSCCKRWCMFLRWMGRNDTLDLGLWTKSSPLRHTFPPGRALRADQLILPLDTHTGRISQFLGLTRRKTLGWKAALEVTESLRQCNAADPTRYDFALSRLGILDLCQMTYRVEICQQCELLPVCRLAQQRS